MKLHTVLHVDDDCDLLRLVAHKLEKHGYSVISHPNPATAIKALADSGARVVLLDIDMPEKSGMTLLQEIKEYDAGIQVIMLSGMVTLMTAFKSMRLGAEGCIFKPIESVQPMLSALEAAFGKINRWLESIRDLERRRAQETLAASKIERGDLIGSLGSFDQ